MVTEQHLVISNLSVGFHVFRGYRDVLDIDTIIVNRGESYGLVGESGSGKTVLGLAILGLLRQPPAVVQANEVNLAGENLLKKTPRQMRAIRGRRIAMIFQDPMAALDPVYTVRSQMVAVLRERTGVNRSEALKQTIEYMKLVELPDPETLVQKYPHELSGGQRQRVIIALALACGADFLLADEPTRNLDVTVQASIMKTIFRLRREFNVSMLFIANNLALVSALCDRVGILLKGRIVETGTVRDVVENPLHPYTLDLLHAVPRKGELLVDDKLDLAEVDSSVSACWHFSRCTARGAACESVEAMRLLQVSETHSVACPMASGSCLLSSGDTHRRAHGA